MKIVYLARRLVLSLVIALFATTAFATTYPTPVSGNTMIGDAEYITSAYGETLITIAQRFDVGLNGIADANPGINPSLALTPGERIRIPTSFILPPLPRNGIVINLPEMRMYYYASDGIVKTYPIGIGRVGKTIPLVHTAVVRKVKNPIWIPPADIRAFNEAQGIILPHVMKAGPDNPLGPYAIYLRLPTYLIHSTIFPDSVGRRASFGCIRMHESDINDFFPLVKAGTPVIIVDMPSKVGWQGESLYLETHDALEEHSTENYATLAGMIQSIQNLTIKQPAFVDWQMVADLSEMRDGMPHEIGFKTHP